ncbi:MFS transporter [Catellatospora sp. TT07R-123]|uniref:MFS transporter n=1 Tax=Catellatospora sp. TT07R-123 TaxID=2733863 RepID=UPI001B06BD9E|nr:MFS transporter [Catellatospora sp. TT07R-123]GHJ43579.1 MFS transporter [Catellatospora sp. TT07R-123]
MALGLLMVFMMVNFADKAVLGLAGGSVMAEFGLSNTGFGLLSSAFYLLFSLSAAAAGWLGDRLPSGSLLVGLAVTWSVAQLPMLLPTAGVAVLAACRIVLGAGEGPGIPLATHAAFSWYPRRARSLPATMIVAGGALGGVVGLPLLALAIDGWGWRITLGALGAAGLLWVLAWLRWGGTGPHRAAGPEAAAGLPYRRMLRTGTWLGSTASAFTVQWALALMTAWLPRYLGQQRGLGTAAIGVLAALPMAGSVVLALGGGAVSQWLLRRRVRGRLAQGLLGGVLAVAAGCGLLLVTRVDATPVLIAVLVVGFAAGNAQTPLNNAAIADVCPPGRSGLMLGSSYALAAVAALVAPTVTGRLIDLAPSPAAGFGTAFDVAGLLLVAGGLVAAVTVDPERDRARLDRAAGSGR